MSRDFRSTRIGRVLSETFGGPHHVDWSRVHEEDFEQASYNVTDGRLATFDGEELTRLVCSAHAHAVRVEIRPSGPRRVKIWLSERGREGAFHERHPTLYMALQRLGEWPARDELSGNPERRNAALGSRPEGSSPAVQAIDRIVEAPEESCGGPRLASQTLQTGGNDDGAR